MSLPNLYRNPLTKPNEPPTTEQNLQLQTKQTPNITPPLNISFVNVEAIFPRKTQGPYTGIETPLGLLYFSFDHK